MRSPGALKPPARSFKKAGGWLKRLPRALLWMGYERADMEPIRERLASMLASAAAAAAAGFG